MNDDEVHENLQDGSAQNGDLLVVGRDGPVHDPKFPTAGVQAEELPDAQAVRLDGRVHVLSKRHDERLFAIESAHPHADGPRELDPAEPFQELIELRLRGPCARVTPEPVVNAIHDVDREPQNQVHGVPAWIKLMRAGGGIGVISERAKRSPIRGV